MNVFYVVVGLLCAAVIGNLMGPLFGCKCCETSHEEDETNALKEKDVFEQDEAKELAEEE